MEADIICDCAESLNFKETLFESLPKDEEETLDVRSRCSSCAIGVACPVRGAATTARAVDKKRRNRENECVANRNRMVILTANGSNWAKPKGEVETCVKFRRFQP